MTTKEMKIEEISKETNIFKLAINIQLDRWCIHPTVQTILMHTCATVQATVQLFLFTSNPNKATVQVPIYSTPPFYTVHAYTSLHTLSPSTSPTDLHYSYTRIASFI
ncbi:hypothetical protein Taro_028758 [Colocasia esculenta]|uniref:Uncharacterized protein n=1 Tax=Colocasia esculenta TaxID=4460 RepID=A0A843VM07_COLES|nr:hypothetical protein [Colocasia esculenta]